MHLVGVRVELPTNNPIVLLREAEGDRRVLPIFIGPPEATAIAFALQGHVTPRPMTHDLIRDLFGALGVQVERIVVTELRESTYYAEIELTRDGTSTKVSSRPSDAIAIAARLGTPIFAEEAVLDEAGVIMGEGEEDEEEEDAEVEKFRRFLQDVNPEDFGSSA
jgi:bifunctional DNase/RNase